MTPPGLFSDPEVVAPAPITAADMPTFPVPPAPQQRPGLFARVAKRVGDNLFQTPTALDGLVTDEDKARARQQGLLSFGIALSQGHGENPLASLGRGLASAQEGYQASLDSVLTQRKNAIALQQQKAQQDKLAMHAKLAQQFLPTPGETMPQTIARLSKYSAAMAAFDPAGAAQLADTVAKLSPPKTAPTQIDLGSHKLLTDHQGNVIRDDKVEETPAQAARAKAQIAIQARNAETAARAERRMEATETRDERRQENTVVHDFNNSDVVKNFHGAEAAYEVLNAARNAPGKNFMRPMAALDAFARMLNPKGAVRVGTLQILKEQGAFGDRLNRYWSMASKGEWPEGMQREIYTMADQMMAEHALGFDHFREETIGRAGAQGLDVDKMEKIITNRKPLPSLSPKKSTGKLGTY